MIIQDCQHILKSGLVEVRAKAEGTSGEESMRGGILYPLVKGFGE